MALTFNRLLGVILLVLAAIISCFALKPEWNVALFFALNHFGQLYPEVAVTLTHLSDFRGVTVLLIIIFAGRRPQLTLCLLAGLAVHFATRELKIWFTIPRPLFDTSLAETVTSLGPPLKATDFSFPSGHSATIAMAAIIISYFYRKPYLYTVFLVVALLAALSRSMVGAHFPADAAAGLMLGIIIAVLCIYLLKIFEPLAERATATLTARQIWRLESFSAHLICGICAVLLVRVVMDSMPHYPGIYIAATKTLAVFALCLLFWEMVKITRHKPQVALV